MTDANSLLPDTIRQPISITPLPASAAWARARQELLPHEPAAVGAATPAPEAGEPMPEAGQTFLGFKLVRELGRGAFARVFLAHQSDLADRTVVLKVSADTGRESLTLAQLHHPNIVPIHSAHRSGRLQALCMPYLGAVTLADVYHDLTGLASRPNSGRGLVSTLPALKASTVRYQPARPPAAAPGAATPTTPAAAAEPVTALTRLEGLGYVEAVLTLGVQLGDGLVHAHDRGVVHRDVKPANVLLTDEGRPMLLDFNLAADARLRDRPASEVVGGTLPYMSPEQLDVLAGRDRPVDARSDLYSLGVILFELLTLTRPFPVHKQTTGAALAQMLADRNRPLPRLRPYSRLVGHAVESIVRHCLEPDPARRYQSARELKEDLERHLADLPLRHAPDPSLWERFGKWRRRRPVMAYTASLAAVVLFAVLISGDRSPGERVVRQVADRPRDAATGRADDAPTSDYAAHRGAELGSSVSAPPEALAANR
jgi:serine/threonine protein kinase